MKKIENIKQLDALIGDTYMYAIIIVIMALAMAFVISGIIKWSGGKIDNSYFKRRVWFIIVGIFPFIVFFLYNALYVSVHITKAPLQAKFSTANIIATLVGVGAYFIIGIISMFIFRRSKWGSILGKTK